MLASIEDLPADGTPKLYQVVAERKDAWTKYDNKPIGSVFLRKTQDGDVVAFNSSCPHAGCSVDLNPNGKMFSCPCHESNFNMEGGIIGKSVSPRGLDELEIDQQLLSKGEVWVTFVNFKAGVTESRGMIKSLTNWLESRTGIGSLTKEALFERCTRRSKMEVCLG